MIALMLVMTALLAGCDGDSPNAQEAMKETASEALDVLVADLAKDRPADAGAYAERLQAYLEAHPSFFGAAAALLDESGTVVTSPYVYRVGDGYAFKDLAEPSYNIEEQEWFTLPLSTNSSEWTAPYFDAGGGEVWMVTRSVPARDAEGVFAIVTTDLVVDAPDQ